MARERTNTKKKARSAAGLTTLDTLLKEEGKLEEFKAIAIREIRTKNNGQ